MKYLHFSRSILLRAVHSLRHLSAIFLSVAIVVLFTAQAAYGAPQATKNADQFDSVKGVLKQIDPIEQLRSSKEFKLARVTTNEFTLYVMPVTDDVVERDGCRYESVDMNAVRALHQIVLRGDLTIAKPVRPWMSTYAINFELESGLELKLFLARQSGTTINGRLNGREVRVKKQIIEELKNWTSKLKSTKPGCSPEPNFR